MSKPGLNLNIQQLRGIAVITVVFFHLNLPFAKTGYLGVDTFFVISGFLMAMLYGNMTTLEDAKIFLVKRSIRLLPAYWFTILAASLASIVFCLPHEVATTNRHSIWAFFFMPNIGFWIDAEYWGGSQFRPLLHLWSLGVEFQFYLIYPLISKFLNSQTKRFALMLSSLLLYICMNGISAKTAFYMMPTRLWQFLLGIIAFEASKRIHFKNTVRLFKLSIFSLFTLLSLPVHISPQSVIFLTVPTTLLIALTLMFSNDYNQNVGNPFWGKFLAWLGKYSFSIYLMHFPIIIFLQYEPFGGTITGLASFKDLSIFLTSLVFLSKFTYSVFEKYTRSSLSFLKLESWGLVSILSFTSIFLAGKFFQTEKFDKNVLKISNAWLDQSEDRCGKIFSLLHSKEKYCPIGNKDFSTRYLLIGNSHTNSIKNTFAELLNSKGISLYINASNNALNEEEAKNIINYVEKLNFSKIIFHSRADFTDFDSLSRILPKLNNLGIKAYYILPVPEYSFPVPKKMFENEKNKEQFPYLSYTEYLELNKDELNLVFSLSNKFGLKVLPTGATFCTPLCMIADNAGLFYFDSNHLTVHGSTKMIPLFKEIMEYP